MKLTLTAVPLSTHVVDITERSTKLTNRDAWVQRRSQEQADGGGWAVKERSQEHTDGGGWAVGKRSKESTDGGGWAVGKR